MSAITADCVMHQATSQAIDRLIAEPTHGIMITGPAGSGKSTIARLLAIGMLGTGALSAEAYASHPYIRIVASQDDKAITIDTIRELQRYLSLKVPGRAAEGLTIARLIVIEDAHLMTKEAQNALLKTLEEPPADTALILTVRTPDAVLPTVLSRVQQITVRPPSLRQVIAFFANQGHKSQAIERAVMISGGLPGLTSVLLSQDEAHPLYVATTHARGILKSKTYERLLLVDGLAKQKELCIDILYVIGRMSRMAVERSEDPVITARWTKILKAAYDTERQLGRSVQAKLAMTNFMLAF